MAVKPGMARRLSSLSLGLAIVGGAGVAEATECVYPDVFLMTSRVAGQVFDKDGVPIEGARVSIMWTGGGVDVATDALGFFEAPRSGTGRGIVEVELWGFERVRVPTYIASGLPFQQLAIRLGLGMSCHSRACPVVSPSPTRLSKAPPCLDGPWSSNDHDDDEWTSTTRRLDRVATQCTAGNEKACNDLARIAETDKTHRKSMYAVKVLTNQRFLADLAQRAPLMDIRMAAIERLSDPTLVATLAKNEPNNHVRVTAVMRLTDPALLAHYATQDPDGFVRQAAAGSPGLDDESTLKSCATRDSSPYVRMAALGNPHLRDQEFLVRAATGTDLDSVRGAAVARLTDQALLRRLVLDDPNVRIRAAAVSNPALRDDTVFAEVAKGDAEATVRGQALARIADPEIRRHTAPYVEIEAVPPITDQAQLAHIATHSMDPRVRGAAVEKITDQGKLVEILRREQDSSVRHFAVMNNALTDQDVLADAAMHGQARGIRVAAAAKLHDQAFAQRVYAEVAQTDTLNLDYWVLAAIDRLTDQTLLTKLALTGKTANVRWSAVSRLEDQVLLERLATSGADDRLRAFATGRLTDRALLSRIARDDADFWVRQAAQETLRKLPPLRQ
jgi:hypothetical protein